MKKISILFAAAALALFVLIFSAAAQTDPAAADLLGRWYMNLSCNADDSCTPMGDLGIIIAYDINEDNTISVSMSDEVLSTLEWYAENGTFYSVVPLTETENVTNELILSEDGTLTVMSEDNSYVVFTREEPVVAFSEEVAADAAEADYIGEWHIKGLIIDGQMIAAQMFGDDVVLTIDQESFLMSDGLAEEQGAYILEEGKLYAVVEGTDSEGQPWENDVMMELHDDGTLFFYFDPGTEEESIFVFTRDQNVFGQDDLMDAFGMDQNAEGGISGLMDSLSSGLENFDFGGLVQQLTGEEGFDLNGLVQQVTGQECLDISGLIQQVTGQEGGFSLSGLLEGLTSSEGTEGEGGFSLSGLLDMFGSGN